MDRGDLCPLDIAVQRLDRTIASESENADPEAADHAAAPTATPVRDTLAARYINVAVALAFFGAGMATALVVHAVALP